MTFRSKRGVREQEAGVTVARIRSLVAAARSGIITADECHAELVIIRHRWEERMADYLDYRRAAKDCVCPLCYGNLVYHFGSGGDSFRADWLQCAKGHIVANPSDAPLRSQVERLEREGEMLTRKPIDEDPAISMAILYG